MIKRLLGLIILFSLYFLAGNAQNEVNQVPNNKTEKVGSHVDFPLDSIIVENSLTDRRKVIYRDISDILKRANGQSGNIQFRVCVDRQGLVRYAEIEEEGTTILDKEVLKTALYSIYGYLFESDVSAPASDCGTIIITLENLMQNTISDSLQSDINSQSLEESDQSMRRRVTYRNSMCVFQHAKKRTGTIAFSVCVNREGKVSFVEIERKGTTITHEKFLEKVLTCMYDYRFDKDPEAEEQECGKIIINFGPDTFKSWRNNTAR